MNEEEYINYVRKRSINMFLILGFIATGIGCIAYANLALYNIGAATVAGGLAIASGLFGLALTINND